MATARALELVGCPFHNEVPSEVIARTDGIGLRNYGHAGHPDWTYVVALCIYGHHFAAAVDFVEA